MRVIIVKTMELVVNQSQAFFESHEHFAVSCSFLTGYNEKETFGTGHSVYADFKAPAFAGI